MSTSETEKLYWNDAFAERFEAELATWSTFRGKPSLILERTLFYPESGGQLGDRGNLRIGGLALDVVDTQIDDQGTIHHLVSGDPTARPHGPVLAAIDPLRRSTQRLQHSAQHMLSRALADVASGPTVSARLGTASSTIDLGLEKIADADVARAEDLVNAIIRDDRGVRAFFPTAAELAELPLRRAPKVTERIRVVLIGDEGALFDATPCGGTHVAKTGQIGAVRVTGVERYKGMMRITFLAGGEALTDARVKEQALAAIARDLSCGPLDVGHAVQKLRTELKAARDTAAELRNELAVAEGDRLLAAHSPETPFTPIVVMKEAADVAYLRLLAGRLATRDDVLAIACGASAGEAGKDATRPIVVQRAESAPKLIDCAAVLRTLGKGGGAPHRAEGRVPASITREALVNALGVLKA
jgi:alanyl-tRNA synthetase